jgi:exonuclease VII small subunit
LKIVQLNAENVKRLVAVEIRPGEDDSVVIVTGKNAQGKTSVLDSIWFALGGGSALHDTPQPIRDGQSHAEVTLDLGELSVTRTWRTDKPMQLKVVAKHGAKYPSPQKVLDKLIGQMSFDPLAFTQLPERQQRQMLEGLVTLPFDPKRIEQARENAYEQRTTVGRDVRALEGQLAGFPDLTAYAELGTEEVRIGDLLEEMAALQAEAVTYADAETAKHQRQHELNVAEQDLESARLQLEDAEARFVACEGRLEEADRKLTSLLKPDLSHVERRMREADVTNRVIRQKRELADLQSKTKNAKDYYDQLTEEIVELDEERRAGLAAAVFPVPGLSFGEVGITYQGVPFSQCSAAEQLRVSIGMAMALNPDIRVIRITDGSLLDSYNMQLIAEMAADRDFQVWIERVDESGEIGIVIEDGQVV